MIEAQLTDLDQISLKRWLSLRIKYVHHLIISFNVRLKHFVCLRLSTIATAHSPMLKGVLGQPSLCNELSILVCYLCGYKLKIYLMHLSVECSNN